jgi:GNAT superfamily N-acetyltransferase
MPTHRIPCHIRWAIARDFSDIIDIDEASYDVPITLLQLDDWVHSQTQTISVVMEVHETICGWSQYTLGRHSVFLSRLAVHPDFRRLGLGGAIVDKLKRKLRGRRTALTAYIPEQALHAQQFLRACGFYCEAFVPDLKDTGLLEFKYHLKCEGAEIIERLLAGNAAVLR